MEGCYSAKGGYEEAVSVPGSAEWPLVFKCFSQHRGGNVLIWLLLL